MDTISSHRLAALLRVMPDLPVLVHVIVEPATFEARIQDGKMTWDAESELCFLDPEDIVEREGTICLVVELRDWKEEMETLEGG